MRCHLTAARLRQFEFERESGPYMSARWAMLRHSGKEVVRRDAILRRRRNSYASSGAFRPYELRGSQEIRRADEAETAYQERRPSPPLSYSISRETDCKRSGGLSTNFNAQLSPRWCILKARISAQIVFERNTAAIPCGSPGRRTDT